MHNCTLKKKHTHFPSEMGQLYAAFGIKANRFHSHVDSSCKPDID